MCSTFQISKDESCGACIRGNMLDGLWWQFYHSYIWTDTSRQWERGISICQQRQLHLTDALAQWPVYWSWLYGEDSVISCTPSLVQYWLCKSFQPTVCYQLTAKYTQSPFVMSPINWGWAIYPPCITAGISFERNACLHGVQKYQIKLTQWYIKTFQNSHLWTAIPRIHWRELGTQS